MNTKIKLICKSVWYYSSKDEDAFFEWINKISVIEKYDGRLDELYLYINNKKISDQDLEELLALFYRYKIDMKQLAVFLNKKNKDWFFDNRQAYWHKKVFAKPPTMNQS